jgi:hypothetical protein
VSSDIPLSLQMPRLQDIDVNIKDKGNASLVLFNKLLSVLLRKDRLKDSEFRPALYRPVLNIYYL